MSDYLRLLGERVLIFDGAMGTQLMALELSAGDFGGARYHGCNEALVLTRPDIVREIHRAYLAAGADVVETDSFMGSRLKLDEYWLRRTHRGDQPAGRRTRARSLRRVCDGASGRVSSPARWARPGC